MPPRVMEARHAGTGFGAWYATVPPVTRFLLTAAVVLSLATRFDLINEGYLILSWRHVLSGFEVWRLITNFLYLGQPSMTFVFFCLWIYQYGKGLETADFQFDPAGFIYMFLVSALVMLFSSFVCFYFSIRMLVMPMYSVALVFVIMYVWSKRNPEQLVSLWGLFQFQAFYLPFVMLGFSLVMGYDPRPEVVGILVGHLYHFLKDLYPQVSGNNPLETPNWLKQLAVDWGLAAPPMNPLATSNQFQAFRGGGRRLGTQ